MRSPTLRCVWSQLPRVQAAGQSHAAPVTAAVAAAAAALSYTRHGSLCADTYKVLQHMPVLEATTPSLASQAGAAATSLPKQTQHAYAHMAD
jgi:hypothetical protein